MCQIERGRVARGPSQKMHLGRQVLGLDGALVGVAVGVEDHDDGRVAAELKIAMYFPNRYILIHS